MTKIKFLSLTKPHHSFLFSYKLCKIPSYYGRFEIWNLWKYLICFKFTIYFSYITSITPLIKRKMTFETHQCWYHALPVIPDASVIMVWTQTVTATAKNYEPNFARPNRKWTCKTEHININSKRHKDCPYLSASKYTNSPGFNKFFS